MKKNTALVIIPLLLFGYVQAQVRPCGQPIADYLFQQRRSIVNQPVADAQKLIRAKKAVEENCLTSVQIRDLAQLFQSEEARLDFARHAFFYAFDQDNYYEVYNAFARFSNAFRLHDYVLSQRNPVFNPTPGNPGNPGNPTFPPVSNPVPNLIFRPMTTRITMAIRALKIVISR
ncbi:MAG: DUF4476 domain-containing protein [Microscillaceae bacterium]|nr:DUF4476 domain-containing protein [Microscillaceae bacterium]